MVLALCLALFVQPARAWVYPEHRDIALLAVDSLDAERRAVFDDLWREARAQGGTRLCEYGADTPQGSSPSCIDWAALSAIAGDHSCSAHDMRAVVLDSRWILAVADVAARLKADLARIDVMPPASQTPGGETPIGDMRRRLQSETARAERINALRNADTRLQQADSEYATRARSNTAHFLLPRPSNDTKDVEYAALALGLGSDISAVGVYAWYHLSAMQKASRLAREQLSPEQRRQLTLAMLFDEAFALHFLQDTFAAGHVAGAWGNASQRQGTHDYYNAAGLEAFTWRGTSGSVVLMGDAHMRPVDAQRAATSVRESLEQLLDTAAGKPRAHQQSHTPAAEAEPDGFDVCRNDQLIRRAEGTRIGAESLPLVAEVLRETPIPGLGAGLGAMPRFRSELGAFIGLAGSIDGRVVDGGFVTGQNSAGSLGGVELAFRGGVGLDGVIGEAGDGLVFASIGLRAETPSTSRFVDTGFAQQAGNLAAAIPARAALAARIRMPFYLIPGDLLLLAPLYFFDPERYTAMAVTAGNGGLIPWQAGWATPIGRFQLVAGRELGVAFYGLRGNDRLLAPGDPTQLVELRSTYFDLPILEYRPYRAFASNQSSTVLFQLFVGADVPRSGNVVSPPGLPPVELKTVWSGGLRLVFDWRYYP
ncbi:hypothetical protein [Rivibacter subsaxonicus]|uniref:hypothetical protein n=1 Tax=Rivibacter subsaxonicus TaxID=457575 RepID=UPI00102B38AA|nr:hypothetical protein [Rivibacter subsaxonicus]